MEMHDDTRRPDIAASLPKAHHAARTVLGKLNNEILDEFFESSAPVAFVTKDKDTGHVAFVRLAVRHPGDAWEDEWPADLQSCTDDFARRWRATHGVGFDAYRRDVVFATMAPGDRVMICRVSDAPDALRPLGGALSVKTEC